jgi:hypothetical protein
MVDISKLTKDNFHKTGNKNYHEKRTILDLGN